MKKKIENIQAIRGIATLFVVFYHIMETEQRFAYSNTILPVFLKICASGVDLFFIVSGFVIVAVTRGKFQCFGETLQFLYNRATRVYSLYWIYTGLLMVFFLLPPEMFSRSREDVNILKSFLLLPQANVPLLVVAWTIVHEMYFYGAFAILLMLPEKHFIKLLAVWSFLVIAASVIFQGTSNSNFDATMHIISHPLTMEFIAGCLIAKMIYAGIRAYGLTSLIIGIFLLAVNHLLVTDMTMERWDRLFFYGLPSALIVYGVIAIELESETMAPKFLRYLGDASYSIYLSHYLILPVIGRIWIAIVERTHIDNSGYADNILAVSVMVLTVLAVGIGSYRFIETPMLSLPRKFKVKQYFNR
ncbi:MAG: acyltransferase family protein [Candidatus Anammoxibacter sp.]